MTGIISPEETMVHAQEAAEALRDGDVLDRMGVHFDLASGEKHLMGTTALQDVDPNVVANAFKFPEPM